MGLDWTVPRLRPADPRLIPTKDHMNRALSLGLRGTALLAAAALALTACSSTGGDSGGASGGAESTPAAGTSLQDVKDAGVLTIGTEGTYSPFSFHKGGSGALTGYDVEIAEAVAAELGVEAEFRETQFDGIFAGLEAGRFDMIANQISINPTRQEKHVISGAYTVSPRLVIDRK